MRSKQIILSEMVGKSYSKEAGNQALIIELLLDIREQNKEMQSILMA